MTRHAESLPVQDFRKVRAWQAARELTLLVYRVTANYPREERFGLTSQMRDAAVSIGANIAEGCGRSTDADKRRLFHFAYGSAMELLHHLIISSDLHYLTNDDFQLIDAKLETVRRMIAAFNKRLRSGPS